MLINMISSSKLQRAIGVVESEFKEVVRNDSMFNCIKECIYGVVRFVLLNYNPFNSSIVLIILFAIVFVFLFWYFLLNIIISIVISLLLSIILAFFCGYFLKKRHDRKLKDISKPLDIY